MSMPTEVEAAYIPMSDGGYVYMFHCPNCNHEYQCSGCTPDEIEHCECGFVMKVIPEEIEEDDEEELEDEEG